MKLLRYLLTDPLDFIITYAGRFKCRVAVRHGLACRGRRDRRHP